MGFVVYNVETTAIVRRKPFYDAIFKSQGAAKACKTRLVRDGQYKENEIEVADQVIYNTLIAGTRQVKNLMTGEMVTESVNTPNYMSVGSEAYWSA